MAASDAAAHPLPDEARHLLVVDDDSRIRQLIARFLGENGYRVTLAESAAEARKKLAQLDFDLMILDVMMPGETGVELAASLSAAGTATPILMLTARSDIDDRIKGLEAGADDYLAKPFDPRELPPRRRRCAAPRCASGRMRSTSSARNSGAATRSSASPTASGS